MADTSLVQSFKLSVAGFSGLSKDALHVYAGLIVWLLAAALFRRSIATVRPLLAVLVVALGIEAFDAFDDWVDLGRWRYKASLYDIVNTMFWPTVLTFMARFTRLLK
jgi:di/tricarboxylate transporter